MVATFIECYLGLADHYSRASIGPVDSDRQETARGLDLDNFAYVSANHGPKHSDEKKQDSVVPAKNEQKQAEPPVADLAAQPVTNIDTPHLPTEIKPAEQIPSVKADSVFTAQQQSVVTINKKTIFHLECQ